MFPDSPASFSSLNPTASSRKLVGPGNEARECTITLLIIILQVTSSALIVGGALSLTDLVSLLQANQDRSSTFEHLASHLLKVLTCMQACAAVWLPRAFRQQCSLLFCFAPSRLPMFLSEM